MRKQLRTLLLIGIALPRLALAVDNSWTNTNFGKWETNSNWSLGVAPASTQPVFVTNAFSKTVTIDSITSGGFPGTMTTSNLTVSAPTVPLSANRLSLDNSGLATPLRVLKVLTVTTNGTLLVLDNAAVEVGSAAGTGFLIVVGGGLAQFSGGSLIASNAIIGLGGPGSGALTVGDGTRILSEVRLGGAPTGSQGTLTINGGTNTVTSVVNVGFSAGTTGAVWLTGGLLVTTNSSVNVGIFAVGQMAVSNGTWQAKFVSAGALAGKGTLTYAGGDEYRFRQLTVGRVQWANGHGRGQRRSTIRHQRIQHRLHRHSHRHVDGDRCHRFRRSAHCDEQPRSDSVPSRHNDAARRSGKYCEYVWNWRGGANSHAESRRRYEQF